MAMPPIVAVEIGTTRTVVAVGECDTSGNLNLTTIGTAPTTGVRKGQIVSIDQAESGLSTALRQAEQGGLFTIRQVILAISGAHIQSTVNAGNIPIQGRDNIITQDDVDEVYDIASSLRLDLSRKPIHIFQQSFSIDDMTGIGNPVGMTGSQLASSALIIHGANTRFENVASVFRRVSVETRDTVFGVCAASLAVLSPEQKKSGVLLIDLGGGTTNYVVFANDVAATAGSLGIGGDHITNDIALAFNIPTSQAEELKITEGSATIDPDSAGRKVILKQSVGFPDRSVGVRSLHTAINARVEETLRVVRAKLDEEGVLPLLGAGVVLVGGGSHLSHITDLARQVFGLPCTIGTLRNIACAPTIEPSADLAIVAGTLIYEFMYGEGKRPGRGLAKHISSLWERILRK